MRKLIVGSLLSAAVAGASAQAITQAEADNKIMQALPALKVSVGSTPLTCEREIDAANAAAGKTDAQAEALFDSSARQVRLQQPVQLTVRLNGVNVTSDARTKYAPTRCLTATTFGQVTPVPFNPITKQVDAACKVGTIADVFIVMSTATTTMHGWNRCYFRIVQ